MTNIEIIKLILAYLKKSEDLIQYVEIGPGMIEGMPLIHQKFKMNWAGSQLLF